MNPLQISARSLSELASPWFCQKCFWLKLRLKGKLPFQFFPGVFSSFDSFQKNLTWLHWERFRKPPSWLEPFGEISDLIQPPHWSKFRALDEKTGIELPGVN